MASTHEDGFREIQLSGKQLVFVGMAGFVIAVGIFLMGVQVGRGVLAQRGLPEASDTSAFAREAEPPPPPASVSQDSTPVTAGEKLSYAERLASAEPPAERLKRAAEPPPPPTPKAAVAAPSAPAASRQPAGSGFEIQVGALRDRGEADGIVKRLVAKGYPAYVVPPRQRHAGPLPCARRQVQGTPRG
jgi:cell division septation protein DedD